MSTQRNDGGPAYPIWTPDMNLGNDAGPGMSLRDWFAGQALVGLCAHDGTHGVHCVKTTTDRAYEVADAMLAARNGEEQ